ncbi:alpha/beta fold hydrolase [Stenotrophomonas sp. NPDC101269]|uniref:alpha/beta fold hydrolase n=1 Tax=Stenotrophomonas TaxID=40323 RepID=UPI00129189B3|nr:alpha/beta hydrolase [Stenotrophomonas nematodicola]
MSEGEGAPRQGAQRVHARLVVLPGLDATGTQHGAFTAAMQRHGIDTTVIAYPVDRAVGYDVLADIVQAALPRDEDYVLLGESFSGPLALRLAAAHPARLRGLVLSTTFARSPWYAWRRLQSLLYWAPVRTLPMGALSWLLLGRWSSAALREALRAALSRVQADVLRTRAVAALGVDVGACAAALRIPALCLHAVDDRLLPSRCQRHLSALLPAQDTVWLEGPHLLLQARPDAAAEAIAMFVATVSRRDVLPRRSGI